MTGSQERDLEYYIMGEIGLPSHDFLNGRPRAYEEKLAAIDKLAKTIRTFREEGAGIAEPNESLIAQAREIGGDETGLDTRTAFQVVSYVVQAHINAYNEEQSEDGRPKDEVFDEMSQFLREQYQKPEEGGKEVRLR